MMDSALYFFVPAVLLAAALANISVWSQRRFALKVAAIVVAGGFIPLAYGSMTEMLSRPKPVSMEWIQRTAEQANVMGSSVQEGEAIYLWLQLPDVAEPRAYVLPWNKELAKQLQGAQREAAKTKSKVKMEMPFDTSLDRQKPLFYAEPQAAPADKQVVDDAPVLFKGGQRSSTR